MNNNTKWNSKLFRNQNTESNNNIDVHNMEKKIKRIKKKKDMTTIYENFDNDSIEEEDYNIDKDDNIQEGLFERDEFTGYGWKDPKHKGISDALDPENLGNIINRLYKKAVYFITFVSKEVVEKCDERKKRESKKKYKRRKKKNIKIVRKYVAMFFCLIASFYAVYNWYYVTTFKDAYGQRIPIIKYLLYRENVDGTRRTLLDDLIEKKSSEGITGILWSIVYFFFEFVIMFLDDINALFLDTIPNTISDTFGRTVTFVFLFIFILNIFYFYIESVKDEVVGMLKGKLTSLSGIIILYVLFKIVECYVSEDPNSHYLSDWTKVLDLISQSNAIASPFLLGFFAVINIIRIILIIVFTVLWVPIIIALFIVFFSFFPMLIYNNYGLFETISKIDKDCTEDFKAEKADYCGIGSKFLYYLKFGIKVFLGDFAYHGLFTGIVILIFIIALFDYRENIKGNVLRNNLVNYSYVLIVAASLLLIKQFSNRLDYQMTQAGWLDNSENKFDFKEEEVNENILEVINSKVNELNNKTVNNVFN